MAIADVSGNKSASEKTNPINLAGAVDYAPGSIVSRELASNKGGSITLFAFDQGQGLSEHQAPFDAFVQVLDGQGQFTIGTIPHRVSAGQAIVMPANIPHSVSAVERFKMLLVMIKA